MAAGKFLLGMELRWDEPELSHFRRFLKRTPKQLIEEKVIRPFVDWVLGWRIPGMYDHKGRVSGQDGQPAWKGLSPWTKETKPFGTRTSPLVSGRGGDGMLGGYRIKWKRAGEGYEFAMTNAARSTSKWSPGFDYPSTLHRGCGPWTVRPRKARLLAWATMSGGMHTFRETHPSGIPARPHIRFFIADLIQLGRIFLNAFKDEPAEAAMQGKG